MIQIHVGFLEEDFGSPIKSSETFENFAAGIREAIATLHDDEEIVLNVYYQNACGSTPRQLQTRAWTDQHEDPKLQQCVDEIIYDNWQNWVVYK